MDSEGSQNPPPQKTVKEIIAEAEAAQHVTRSPRRPPSRLGELWSSTKVRGVSVGVLVILMFLPLACYLMPTRESGEGDFEGFHEASRGPTVVGWVWDRSAPNTPISVTIEDGKNPPVVVVADLERNDLVSRGVGNGKHGFEYTIPVSQRDNLTYKVWVTITGTKRILEDTPRTMVYYR